MRKQLSLSEFQSLILSFPLAFEDYDILENKIKYSLKDSKDTSLCLNIPRIYNSDEPAYPSRLKEQFQNKVNYLIILVEAGSALVASCEDDKILEYKLIKKYMVRKTQGKAQYSHLAKKGKSRLGSRIRLQQTKQFFIDLDFYIKKYEDCYDFESLYLHCSPSLKGEWLSNKDASINKKDPRLKRLGLSFFRSQ